MGSTPPSGVALVVTPPGYGRTTLAAQVAETAGGTVVWLSVDRVDIWPGRLLEQLEDQLVPAEHRDAATEWVHRCDRILAALDGTGRTWLVLDDVQSLRDSAAARELAYLAARLPAGTRMLLTSNASVPELVAGVDVGRQRVVDATDARLSAAESYTMLTGQGFAADDPGLAALVRACAGWPAAAVLAAQRRTPARQALSWLLSSGAERLFAGWWANLPEAWRAFLLDTAMLRRLHPELCDLVRGRDDSAELLFEIVAAQGFLLPCYRADVLTWERHPLLSAFLSHRKGRIAPAAEIHRQVSDWAARHSDPDLRITELSAAGDHERALDLVLQHEDDMMVDGRADEVLSWYAGLPDGLWVQRAPLLLRQAWASLLSGDLPEARGYQAELRQALTRNDHGASQMELQGEAALLGAYLALHDADLAGVLTRTREAERMFQGQWDRNAHQMPGVLRGHALLHADRFSEAAGELAAVQSRPPPNPVVSEVALAALVAGLDQARGNVRAALTTSHHALTTVQSTVLPGAELGLDWLVCVRGDALTDLARPQEARADLELGLAAAGHKRSLDGELRAHTALARLDTLLGRPADALAHVASARAAAATRNPSTQMLLPLVAVEVLARLRTGDAARADHLLRLLPDTSQTQLLGVRLAQLRRPGSGTTRLARVKVDDIRTEVARLVLLASASAGSQASRATGILSEVGPLAHDAGILTALVGVDQPTLALARSLARRSAQDGLAELVSVAEHSELRSAVVAVHLSAGERELLSLLPGRDTNAVIARSLNISVNTVKTRLRRLYAKLGVTNRAEAVAEARRRGAKD